MVEEKLFLQVQNSNIVSPNEENMIVMPITKRMEIIMIIHVCFISRMNFDYQENGEKKSFSYESEACNIIYPNDANMIVVPIRKGIEIITSIHVCLISQININYKEYGGQKSF